MQCTKSTSPQPRKRYPTDVSDDEWAFGAPYLTLMTEEVPHVEEKNRLTVDALEGGFFRVIGHLGFMEEPNVPRLLERCRETGLEVNIAETTFFLSRETIIPTASPGMAVWRERIFAVMARNAQSATAFFNLPANRVVELGMQVEF